MKSISILLLIMGIFFSNNIFPFDFQGYKIYRPVVAIDDPNYNYIEGQPITIKIYFYDTHEELIAEYRRQAKKYNWTGRGFTLTITTDSGQPYMCEMHLIKTNYVYHPEMVIYGHELLHCVNGGFHY